MSDIVSYSRIEKKEEEEEKKKNNNNNNNKGIVRRNICGICEWLWV